MVSCFRKLSLNTFLHEFHTQICKHTHKRLATPDGEIVDPEISVKFEMWYTLEVHGAQT